MRKISSPSAFGEGLGAASSARISVRSASVFARGRRTDIEDKLGEVMSEASAVGKVGQVAKIGVGHVVAQIVGTAGLISMLAGLALAAAGIWWR